MDFAFVEISSLEYRSCPKPCILPRVRLRSLFWASFTVRAPSQLVLGILFEGMFEIAG